jgi:hypothetical protein
VIVRVLDSSNPPNPAVGANIILLSYAGRTPQNQPIVWAGRGGYFAAGNADHVVEVAEHSTNGH